MSPTPAPYELELTGSELAAVYRSITGRPLRNGDEFALAGVATRIKDKIATGPPEPPLKAA